MRSRGAAFRMRPAVTAILCVVAAGIIPVLDAVQASRDWAVPVLALLDEPAHLLTAALVLAAVLPWRARAAVPWVLAGAVLIDLDHVPLYLWGALVVDGDGRPVTHSLAVVLLLALLGGLARGRPRRALLGLAAGVALHLVRDIATGPGVPLFWPVLGGSVRLPWVAYYGVVVTATLAAVSRQLHRGSRPVAAPWSH